MFQASAAVVLESTVSVKVPPVASPIFTLYILLEPITFSMRPVLSIVTAVGAPVKVITHGVANAPEPVTEVTGYTSVAKGSLKICCSDVPIDGSSCRRVNREQEGATDGGADIHIVDSARTGNIFNETGFVHGDGSRSRCKGNHPRAG